MSGHFFMQGAIGGSKASLTEGVLLWQVAVEYLAATRKLEPLGYDRSHDRAEDLMQRFQLCHWDAMLVAAGLVAQVDRLYTEDFGYAELMVCGWSILLPST